MRDSCVLSNDFYAKAIDKTSESVGYQCRLSTRLEAQKEVTQVLLADYHWPV